MSINKDKIEKKFFEEYSKLNDAQRQAVDTIEGPVMVIAGPGTGKTQILASRIGKILLEGVAEASNILCLTYTDAGVIAMRKRLIQFIGPDAYKVSIYTFHAFCNDVIQDNLSLFEKRELDAITELEKIQLFKELIDSFPKNHPLKRYRGDVYYEAKNLDWLFSAMKREGWTSTFIIESIDRYLEDLPLRDEFIYKRKYKDFKVGDLKQDKINEEKERMDRLKAAVSEFNNFQSLMHRRGRYDFDDMINWVIKAFETNQNLLSNYQERFQYILVDEFQDTSGTQSRIVDLLISYWDQPNVFVVGDDDQSIFRFQGANVLNMEQFAKTYKDDLVTVVLTNNYRSTQPILDISKTLIGRNSDRLIHRFPNLSKDLLSSNINISHLKHPPLIREYQNPREEMIGVTLDIEKLLAQGTSPGKIAVIYRENKYGEELSEYFKLRNIPAYSNRKLNMLTLPLARKLFLMLRYVAAEHDISFGGDEMLFEVLHFDWFGIPPIEIAKLTMEAAEKRGADKIPLRQLLIEKSKAPARDLFSTGVPVPLKHASTVLEDLIALVPNTTLQVFFETMIREAGVLNLLMSEPNKHWNLQVLTAIFDFIKEETHRRPLMTLEDLVALIDLMDKEEIRLEIARVSGSENGVNLMTSHGSKGLEFQYVFLVNANANSWEKKRANSRGYKLPDTINGDSVSNPDDDHQELRRLFYVALTRAEQHLSISYSKFRLDGKGLESSKFITEIQDEHEIKTESVFIGPDEVLEFSALQFDKLQAPELDKIEESFIDRILEKFVMNVTALNNYLKCPLEFYFKNLVRIPSPKNEATEFGSSVHHAVEKLFSKMLDSEKKEFPSKVEFINDFVWYMHRHRESFTQEQFNRRLEYGQEVLSNYYDNYIHSFNKIVTVERMINNVMIKGVPLKGKLDKLEFNNKMVNVVDYKSGDPDKAKTKLKPPHDKDPNGGDYWRQAVFYKILVDNYPLKDWKVESTEFDFIEPDKKKLYQKAKVTINATDITTVTEQIVSTWDKIQKRDFYTGCGKPDCHWCDFVKTNKLQIALHDVLAEEEE